MMSDEALLAAFDAQARAEPDTPPPGVRHEPDGPVLRVVGYHQGFISAPPDLDLDGPGLDALIARQRDYFADRGEPVEWKTYSHDRTADLPARLLAAGFAAEDPETVVIGPTAALATEPVLPEGVRLREVTAAQDLRAIADMQTAVWGEDCGWMAADLARELAAASGDLVVLVAETGREVISSGRIAFRPGTDFAGLWGGSTLAHWRGKGIYRALVARRAQLAAARDVPWLQVDASADSAPILRRLGFRAVTTTTPYVWTPPAASS